MCKYFFIMRVVYSVIAFCLAAFNALAAPIENASGQLALNIPDKSITELEVTGTINALDFKFIADELTELKSLNLSEATITAYSSSKALFANARTFSDNALPVGCFANSSLSSITLPSSLTVIGEGAFVSCNGFTSIVIPQSVDSIAPYAFSACENLATITIPASVREIGTGAFSHCTALTSVTVTESDVDLTIGDNAFYGCTALTSVNLANRTNSIGKSAFCNCSNSDFNVTFGDSSRLSSIGESAFQNSGIKAFDFSRCPHLTVIPQYAFASSKLVSVSIPDNITFVAEGAFFNNANLASIDLANNSASIAKLQFAGCTLAQNTGLTDETTEVGDYAYYGWNQVEKLIIPENVSHIGDYAFGNMSQLAKVTSMNPSAPSLGEAVFSGITPINVLLTTKIASTGYKDGDQWRDFTFTLNGDASHNGVINVNDITAIISHNNGKTPTNFLFEAADVNVDNVIDDTDVNGIVDIISNEGKTDN